MTQRNRKRSTRYDEHVGARLRIARMSCGISQGALGQKLALTFQQIQKYERGTNRISAGRLFEVSVILQVEIAYFFEGLHQPLTSKPAIRPAGEASTLLDQALIIRNPRIRRQVLKLIRALATEAEAGQSSGPRVGCQEIT